MQVASYSSVTNQYFKGQSVSQFQGVGTKGPITKGLITKGLHNKRPNIKRKKNHYLKIQFFYYLLLIFIQTFFYKTFLAWVRLGLDPQRLKQARGPRAAAIAGQGAERCGQSRLRCLSLIFLYFLYQAFCLIRPFVSFL